MTIAAAITWLAISDSFVLTAASTRRSGTSDMAARYARAERRCEWNVRAAVRNVTVTPNWTGDGDAFWYRRQLVLGAMTALLLVPAVFGPIEARGLRRLWSVRPLAWVGTVSYGLYLWHFDWMKRSIARPDPFGSGWPGWFRTPPGDSSLALLLGVGLGVGLVFAAASWYLLEAPLQRYKGLLDPRRPHVDARSAVPGAPDPASGGALGTGAVDR